MHNVDIVEYLLNTFVRGYLIVSSFYIASPSSTFMEVFKAIAKQDLASQGNVAIRADQKSYSYKQLISSAQKISNLLCGSDVKAVSYI
jgi:malonyl-CoA/methylmalonyl-CoA synthetase